MARMRPPGPTQGIDAGIGFLGFFAAVFLVITMVCELTGRPALGYALVLLALVVGLVLEVRHRSRVLRRHEAAREPEPVGAADRS